ncbi:Tetraspanin-6 [Geodia barretti]|uniref:Tetraspanin-6 n=1 Tax=Geodia barretti TaxID=519541 RepID=A0AA35VY82_GEOBA|nr:Tetraspanin-6 [Geodia barretti]
MSSAMECLTKFNQLILIIVNIFVALLGICVMIVGSWAKADSKEFFLIADDDTEYTQVSVLLIVVGIFVLIIGVVGAVGALFASKAFGRIILVVYAISLGLLVVCEIAGGITAAVARNKVESVFRDSANSTFSKYNDSRDSSERDTWNQFQKDFKCCGVESYKDYRTVFKNDSVPVSCCDSRKIDDGENCTMVVQNVTNNANHYIYSKVGPFYTGEREVESDSERKRREREESGRPKARFRIRRVVPCGVAPHHNISVPAAQHDSPLQSIVNLA